MKLQDALQKIIREFGMSVIREKRLVYLLSDYKAFDDYPAMKQIIKAFAEDGFGKDLCRAGTEGRRKECLKCAGRLKKSLSEDKGFRPSLASYAVDSILFAMGLVPASSVKEPSYRGFDPLGDDGESQEQEEGASAPEGAPERAPDAAEPRRRTAPPPQAGSRPSHGSGAAGSASPSGQQIKNRGGLQGSPAPAGKPPRSRPVINLRFWGRTFLSLLSPLCWFTSKGRLSRAQFWIWLAAWGLMVYLLYAVSYWLSWSGIVVAALLLFFSFKSIVVRRGHDVYPDEGDWEAFGAFVFVPLILAGIEGVIHWALFDHEDPLEYWMSGTFHILFGAALSLAGLAVLALILAGFIIFFFLKGDEGSNRHGPDPTE